MLILLGELMQIGFWGPKTSFSHEVALEVFPNDNLVPLNSIQDIFESLITREITEAIIPLENSMGGIVSATLDELIERDIFIIGEYFLHEKHCFLARQQLDKIKKIYSRPKTFTQCRTWIERNAVDKELIEVSTNSGAAEQASIGFASGAIASSLAGDKFGLNIIEKEINDNKENVTRFIIISKRSALPKDKKKTGLIFGIKDQPGSLFEILKSFKKFDVNLMRIDSRPSRRKEWECLFFAEIGGNSSQKNVSGTLAEIKEQASFFKILGSY
jgi:chorismate mutase / prephenate dehydratase